MAKKIRDKLPRATQNGIINALMLVFVPLLLIVLTEWAHRGGFSESFFTDNLLPHLPSYLLTWVLVALLYAFLCILTRRHWPAVLITGILTVIPGVITWYKLEMRGEPFLPWDISQVGDLAGVASKITLQIPASLWFIAGIFLILFVLSFLVRMPAAGLRVRLAAAVITLAAFLGMLFGVFMNSSVLKKFGVQQDMWMQDRYYRNHGVIMGFLSNLEVLNISAPDDYSEESVRAIEKETEAAAAGRESMYPDSYGATAEAPEQQPNIIFVMNESFYDVTRLEGIEYDVDLTPNLHRLQQEAAHGYIFSPSFGGGTCDVEFEALTGYSIEYLPSGCKPYQQHVTHPMFSIAQFLKSEGYETLAIHGYYRKFWSRDTAYPNLGIDTFIAAEDFVNPEKKRGFISDAEMTSRIIEEYESRSDDGPVFIHAVTMQNHTTYDESRYPEDELVDIVSYPEGLSDTTISQLRDFATGVHEADAALGELVDYFSEVDEPTIIVFWGDHFNPVGKGYELYEKTGYIEKGDTTSPKLRQTDLLIWSNYDDTEIDLGTISSYNISLVMMELYGLEKPLWFEYLLQQMDVLRGLTHGIAVNPDGSFSETLTQEQQESFDERWILQYDLMFGEPYLEDYVQEES